MRTVDAHVTIVVTVAAIICASAVTAASSKATPTNEFAVYGYLPEYRKHGFDYDAAFQTGLTHLIFFSIEVDPTTSLPAALDRLPSKEEMRIARAAANRVGGKLLLGFGGNARSAGFGKMVSTAGRRKTFLDALQKLAADLEVDGVDYNWEYPANANEWHLWRQLMLETKERLNGGPAHNVVTFTMYLDPNHYQVITQFSLLDVADAVLCMAYDQHGKHSTMDFARSAIRLARQNKFPMRKFALGVPFYGRDMRTGHPETYAEIERRGLPNDSVDVAGTQYFNSRQTIKKKTALSINAGIGGVMIWEIGQDVAPLSNPRSLMTALHEAILERRAAEQQQAEGSREPTDSQDSDL